MRVGLATLTEHNERSSKLLENFVSHEAKLKCNGRKMHEQRKATM